MDLGDGLVFAEGLDVLHGDGLTVDFDSFGSQSLGEVGSGDRTEDASLLCLGSDYQRQVGDLLGQSLCVGQDLGILVGTLLEVLREDLLRGCGSCLRVTLDRKSVV